MGEATAVYLVEFRIGEFFTWVSPLDAGTVDQDANMMPISNHLGYKLGHVFSGAQIGRVDNSFPAKPLDCFQRSR